MHRREFVTRVGIGLAGLHVLPGALRVPNGNVRRLTRIGIQAYGVRHELARDLDGTLARLRAIGYTDMEVNWHIGMTPSPALHAALERAGIRASSAHMTSEPIMVGWERHLEAARGMGHEQLVCYGMPSDGALTPDDWRDWADRFNTAGATAKHHGIQLAYHTEPEMLRPIGGEIPLDLFATRLDPSAARLQLDIGNMAMAGADPVAYLARYADRVCSLHIKDVPVMGKMGDTELGAGVLDLKRILSLVRDPDHTLFFVEQEGAKDPLESSRIDFAYLSKLEF